jgi:ankyrin repeat protein
MQKIYKEYVKAQSDDQSTFEPLDDLMAPPVNIVQASHRTDRDLTMSEKKYLLATERGDIIKVRQYLEDMNNDLLSDEFDKNAVDPLGRNALHIAIEYENLEMIELLLNFNVESGEAILHAINEEFVEAVEMLLNYEDNGGNLDVSLI